MRGKYSPTVTRAYDAASDEWVFDGVKPVLWESIKP